MDFRLSHISKLSHWISYSTWKEELRNWPASLVVRLWNISINFRPSRTQLISPLGRNFVRTIRVRNYAVCSISHISSSLDTDSIIQIKDWYAHKMMYPWLLPGFNRTLSRMPQKFWESTPRDSNLVETAHVATNRNTCYDLVILSS